MGFRLAGICLAALIVLGCAAPRDSAKRPDPDALESLPKLTESQTEQARSSASRGELFIPAAFAKQIVTIECDDGYRLAGDYLRRGQSRGKLPGILFIHGLGENRRAWYPLSIHLAGRGYAILTVDLRGHGENPGQMGNPAKTQDELSPEDFLMMSRDIRNCIGHLAIKKEIDGGRICVIGSGLGANLALIAASESWADAVRCVIAVSPGLDYHGLKTAAAAGRIPANKSVYLAAGREDQYSFESASQIYAALSCAKDFDKIEGEGHGIELFRSRIFPKIPEWIMKRMPPVIPENTPGAN